MGKGRYVIEGPISRRRVAPWERCSVAKEGGRVLEGRGLGLVKTKTRGASYDVIGYVKICLVVVKSPDRN